MHRERPILKLMEREHYQATDDDLPVILGGTWVDPDSGKVERKLVETRERLKDDEGIWIRQGFGRFTN